MLATKSRMVNSESERLEEAITTSTYQRFIRNNTIENYPHVFLHPQDLRKSYTSEEKKALEGRDFKARLFFANRNIGQDTVFLQSYFSDNHPHEANFNFVQYFFKSIVATKNYTSARVSLTQLLVAGFLSDESQYKSFAVTMASALSNDALDTHFEICPDRNDPQFLQGRHPMDIAFTRRKQFCILMNIVFSKFQARRFLLGGEGRLNVYRLGHCRAAFWDGRLDRCLCYVDSVFCFLLQLFLAAYVGLEMINIVQQVMEGEEKVWHTMNIPLAFITTFYSCIVFYADFKDTRAACKKVYHKFTVFQAMDVFVNIALHPLLLVAGFVVIVNSDSFIEAVLNGVALLFIIEVDDNLYKLLNLSTQVIVDNYLVKLSMKQLHMVLKGKLYKVAAQRSDYRLSVVSATGAVKRGSKAESCLISKVDPRVGVDFGDYYLTNQREQGTNPTSGTIFQPFKLKRDKYSTESDDEPKFGRYFISPSSLISEHCLIKKITWQYISFEDDLTTNPRIGRLEIELLKAGHDPIIINDKREEIGEDIKLRPETHTLEGVFIITNFQMSTDIRRLRLCGTTCGAKEFLDACEYYSLWDLSSSARKLLEDLSKQQNSWKNMMKDDDSVILTDTTDAMNHNTSRRFSSVSMDGSVKIHDFDAMENC